MIEPIIFHYKKNRYYTTCSFAIDEITNLLKDRHGRHFIDGYIEFGYLINELLNKGFMILILPEEEKHA